MKIGQSNLAQQVGLTFQQIQKYEKGVNRIGASMLCALARILTTTPAWFFIGLEPTDTPDKPGVNDGRRAALRAFALCPDGQALAAALPKLTKPQRRHVLALMATLAYPDRDAPI